KYEVAVADLTPALCGHLYTRLTTETTRFGTPFRVDSHRNMLAVAKRWAGFCIERGWLRSNPFAGVKGVGRRHRGKRQLRRDELRKWSAKAVELAGQGEVGAVAAMMSLMMAMGASEIVQREVRDVDDDASLLWITDEGDDQEVKTENRKRQ